MRLPVKRPPGNILYVASWVMKLLLFMNSVVGPPDTSSLHHVFGSAGSRDDIVA